MTTLLACSAGGHLKELVRLLPRFDDNEDVVWLTFDTALSRVLLKNQDHIFAKYAAPREIRPLLGTASDMNKLVQRRNIKRAISTGAGLALAAFIPVIRNGGRCHYIESAARSHGPSMTGRLCSFLPRTSLYTQYRSSANGRWTYEGSVFDAFESESIDNTIPIRKVLVTIGTSETHSFRRLIDRLVNILPPHVEVVWQTGATDVGDLPIKAHRSLPADEMLRHIQSADVVVAHAGVGSALTAWECGKLPVLIPRRIEYGEHVDDHQIEIARDLSRRSLCVTADAGDLTFEDLKQATAMSVQQKQEPTFALT